MTDRVKSITVRVNSAPDRVKSATVWVKSVTIWVKSVTDFTQSEAKFRGLQPVWEETPEPSIRAPLFIRDLIAVRRAVTGSL